MKKSDGTFWDKINEEWLSHSLYIAFLEARKGKLKTADEYNFEIYWRENIRRLTRCILDKKYEPSRSVAFIIRKPVIREIFAAPFRDRVVHHLLYNEVAEWWDRRLINNSFSCRKEKGVLYGIKRLEKDIARASNNYTKKAYVIKLDVQGYFMSLSRRDLFKRAVWGLKKQFPRRGPKYQLLKYLWHQIIFDDPVKGVRLRRPLDSWKDLAVNKSLLHQPKGRGIVIGNLSSQLLSNIYLDLLDRFVKQKLGYKYYGRYVDDFYIVVSEEDYLQAKRDIKVIEEYLLSLGLILHPKKRYIQSIDKGVNFLGMVLYPHKIVPGKRFKGEFYKAVHECVMGHRKTEAIISYLGYCKHCNAKMLCKKMFDSVGWEYRY
ncbi:RNA-directed DNA polymerase [Candidatus Saccharibacteria bacterium]|nr:RNA-directed DNA polymerase [Candidatus Saccharibacteria bacterium]